MPAHRKELPPTPHPPAPPGLGSPNPVQKEQSLLPLRFYPGPQCAVCLFLSYTHTRARTHTHTHTHTHTLGSSGSPLQCF